MKENSAADSSAGKVESDKVAAEPEKAGAPAAEAQAAAAPAHSRPIPAGNGFIYSVTRFFVLAHFRLGGGRVYGRENIPRNGRFIVAPNHASHIDPPLISSYCPRRPHVIAKKELFEKPILNIYFRGLGAFPVDRGKADRKAIKRAIAMLETEAPLMIFPEGTRSTEGQLRKAEIGLGMIAHATRSPVVPVYIKGSDGACSPMNPKFKFVKMEIHFGKPLLFEAEYTQRGTREVLEAIGAKTMQAIAELRDGAP